jgi:hypothetical protein
LNLIPPQLVEQHVSGCGTNQVNSQQQHINLQQQYIHINQRSNHGWGSSIHNSPNNSTRLFFQKINGLKLKYSTDQWKTQLKFMKKTNIEICGLAETNTDWSYRDTKQNVCKTAKHEFTNIAIAYSTSEYQPRTNSEYLPGGCLHISVNHWNIKNTT